MIESSMDEVALKEVLAKLDTHTDNQNRFSLPSRLIAKIFLFRWIYKGSAYAYSIDNDFRHLGGVDYWQSVIDAANAKYSTMAQYQNDLIEFAKHHGYVDNPFTGRRYPIEPKITFRGQIKWPEPEIVNLPNQGFGADIVALIRDTMYDAIVGAGKLEIVVPKLTVHDSILHDCYDVKEALWARNTMNDICHELPALWEKEYGYRLVVPHKMEHEIGIKYGWMHSFN
jgi:DNA polymerase I-like protein with 3'-5' exonuclease and polymerase domains